LVHHPGQVRLAEVEDALALLGGDLMDAGHEEEQDVDEFLGYRFADLGGYLIGQLMVAMLTPPRPDGLEGLSGLAHLAEEGGVDTHVQRAVRMVETEQAVQATLDVKQQRAHDLLAPRLDDGEHAASW